MWALLQGGPVELHSLVVVLRHLMGGPHAGIVIEIHRVDRTEAQGPFKMLECVLRTIRIVLDPTKSAPGPGAIGIECQGSFKQHPCSAVAAHKCVDRTEHSQNESIV